MGKACPGAQTLKHGSQAYCAEFLREVVSANRPGQRRPALDAAPQGTQALMPHPTHCPAGYAVTGPAIRNEDFAEIAIDCPKRHQLVLRRPVGREHPVRSVVNTLITRSWTPRSATRLAVIEIDNAHTRTGPRAHEVRQREQWDRRRAH